MLEGLDQAAGLRRLQQARALHLMAFPLDGGQDADWIAVRIAELARALRALGARPVVVDASGGRVMAALGLRARHDLADLLQGERAFDTVAQATPDGIWALRADRGLEAFVASGRPAQWLFSAFARLPQAFDALVLAMPSGELACLAAPEDVVPVIAVPGDDAGMARAYATVKDLATRFGYSRFAAAVGDARGAAASTAAARGAHARLATVARSFLDAEVSFAGRLPAEGDAGPALADLAQNLLHTAATPLSLH